MKTHLSVLAPLASVLVLLVGGAGVFGAQPELTLIDYARKGDLEGMKRRLARGDKVDQAEVAFPAFKGLGLTSLQYAVTQGRVDMVKLLIDHRADVNLTHLGSRPLTDAARDNRLEIAKLLLSAGAGPNRGARFEVRGETPLFVAVRNGHFVMADLLIAKGARVDYPLYMDLVEPLLVPTKPEKLLKEVEFLLKNGFDVKKPYGDVHGTMYPLQLAVQTEQAQVVKLFIEKGADVNAVCEFGSRPLCNAAWQDNREIVKMLIDAGADVNAGEGGGTPLAAALVQGHFEIAELLTKKKAQATIDIYKYLLASTRPTLQSRRKGVEFLLAHGLDQQDINLLISIAEDFIRPDIVEYLRSRKAKR